MNKYTMIAFVAVLFFLFFLHDNTSYLKKNAFYKLVTSEQFDPRNKQNSVHLSEHDKKSGFVHAAYG